jgi:hypothetical protein
MGHVSAVAVHAVWGDNMTDDRLLDMMSNDISYIRKKVDTISDTMGVHETRISILEKVIETSTEVKKMRRQFRQFIAVASIGLAALIATVVFHILPLL